MERLELLRKCDVFRELNDAQLQTIWKIATTKTLSPGATLCKQDDIGENFYVVADGLVAIILELGPLSQRQVQVASNCDAVNWSALIEPYKCTATAKALEKTKVLALNSQDLNEIFTKFPEIESKIFKGVARLVATRLRNAYAQLVGVVSPDETQGEI
ncbi:MAG: cyclic nucleotide-binding domain-containing protein [Chloroflexota bacterium]